MSDLKDSIQKSKEERIKKLEALRKAKQDREEAKKRQAQYLEPSMRDDMNRSYNSDLSLNISGDSPQAQILSPKKADIGIKTFNKMYLMPKAKSIVYEREIQVEIETDSEDEEKTENKGVRNAANERTGKAETKEEEVAEAAKPKEMDPEEAEVLIGTKEFGEFFNRCSFVVEKALEEKYNVIEDFILQQKVEDPFDQKGKMKLLQMLHFKDEDRCISSLDWSAHFDDTIVASYIKAELSETKLAHGVINIWHLEDPSVPKHTLYSQSSITQAQIYPNDPNILLGGSYTGQLLIWDLRAKALPIQRSPALNKGHTFPVIGISFAESRHSSNCVSLSSDGKLCVWMMSLLQTPVDIFEIKQRNEISINCMDFLAVEPWNYTVGTEEGLIINGIIQGSLNIEKEEINNQAMAPITSVHNHPNTESSLLLASSVDWTVRLYQKGTGKHLMSIDAYDEYVYDAKWSPANPCIFACCDGDGNLDVWDIGKSIETPYTRQNTSSKALNRVSWDNNGYRIVAGNSASAIYIYQLEKDFAHAKNDDWLKAIMHLGNNPN
ncbi:hypothetical protein SteCoe_13560 [Stentor coeruleus]|uniref:Uncharacterized protein n=1 Tax=Stentor coeruleus TaxID=5963 RepID=A0A1R2C842_9CILI|nr:hypothetical protein SteCoe_13560 [Stentor coeruleus]